MGVERTPPVVLLCARRRLERSPTPARMKVFHGPISSNAGSGSDNADGFGRRTGVSAADAPAAVGRAPARRQRIDPSTLGLGLLPLQALPGFARGSLLPGTAVG